MGDREGVLEELYVLWVEAQILQCGIQGNSETGEAMSNPQLVAGMTSEEARRHPSAVANTEGQTCNVPTDKPVGEAQLEGVLPNSEAAQVADVAEEINFGPQQFWLLLAQAGYESW